MTGQFDHRSGRNPIADLVRDAIPVERGNQSALLVHVGGKRDLVPGVGHQGRFAHLGEEIALAIIFTPASRTMKIGKVGTAPLGKGVPPPGNVLVATQLELPIHDATPHATTSAILSTGSGA